MAAPTAVRLMTDEDRPAIERLWQLYSHDLSEVRGSMPNDEGLYRAGRLPTYFGDADKRGYVITYDGALAGFAFVDGLAAATRTVGDFFVVRAVRRKHVGYDVARYLIAEFPGQWEIGFQAENVGTPAFWRRVVADAVGTGWREETRPVPGKPHIPHDHFLLFTA